MTRKVWLTILLFATTPFLLWLLPQQQRLYAHLLGTPALWGLISMVFLSSDSHATFLGQRKVWPFVWIPGLLALSMSFLGAGFFWNLLIFSYGVSNQPVSLLLMLTISPALLVAITLGIELPLRQKILGNTLLRRGIGMGAAFGICASLGVLRSLPFYWTTWVDPSFLISAILTLFLRELALCRLYVVSGNVLACGVYHTAMVLIEAFVLSDVLGPYLPSFHWISSNMALYWVMNTFHLLPFLVLSWVRPPRCT